MERVVFDKVWKKYDRKFGSNRFRKFLSSVMGRHPERNEFWALQDLSFRLEEGRSLGIIGPNGSGKTTALRVLSGISHIDRGHVRVHGTVAALIALGAGFHPELSGRENIYLNGSILGLKRTQINAYFDDIVDFAGIGEYIDSPVKRYSSGMFVRLGFAVAAQVQPDVLLVDEVLAVGDARFQARCHERIAELRCQGTCIVLVSHDLWAIRQSCQEGIFLKDGQIQNQGDIATVINAYNQQIQKDAIESLTRKDDSDTERETISCDLEFRNAQDEKVSEITLGDLLTIRLYFRCDEPIEKPTLVIETTAHHGPCAMVLRSRKADWKVERLQGEGHIDVTIENTYLNPGRYAIALHIKDSADLAPLGKSRFREFYIKAPNPDWCYENCFYVPDAKWSLPVEKQ